MKRLLLLRHAKSSWAEAGMRDIDRPLAPRGRRAAALMAAAMAERALLPDRVLCSPARRTRETLAALTPHLGEAVRVTFADGLYEPASGDYRAAIAAEGDDAECLLVIGHNPSIQATALYLIGVDEAGLQPAIAAKYPTGALVALDFDLADWSAIRPNAGSLALYLRPRDLTGEAADDD